MGCWWPAKKFSWHTDAQSSCKDAVCADDGDMLLTLQDNAQEETSAEEIAGVTVLHAWVKHLEMQQGLMDVSLETMSKTCQIIIGWKP